MSRLDDIRKRIEALNKNLDSTVDDLMRAVQQYQVEYENELRRMGFDIVNGKLARTAKNYNLAMGAEGGAKYDRVLERYVNGYDAVAESRLEFNRFLLGIDASLNYKDIAIIKKLKEIDLESMYQKGMELDTAVKKSLVNAIALNTDYNTTIANLTADLLGAGEKLGLLVRYVDTYARTSLFGLSRMIDREISQREGVKEYIYFGPVMDNRIRPFCAERVGEIFTEAEIAKFGDENGSGLDGFYSPGGWSCRHSMIAVPAE